MSAVEVRAYSPLLDPQSLHKDGVLYASRHSEAGSHVRSQAALDGCAEADVPILKLLNQPCPPGMHGYGCDTRWDMHDSFLPRPRRWLRQFNASAARPVDCQRGFFDAFLATLTRMHWEQEWDAQPFRISATPPRTIGKMLHQLVTANYYHLTLGPSRPPLRAAPAPGHHYKPLPQPGFRWNVLDYGGGIKEEIDYKRLTTMPGNVLSRPLSAGRRCAGVRAAWHCLWQRFPSQRLRPAPAPGTPIGEAAHAMYNLSLSGKQPGGFVQYLIAGGVTDAFTQVTAQVRAYIAQHVRVVCHRGGPYCAEHGTPDDERTPLVGLHVRQGDSCDLHADEPGPFNAMFRLDEKTGKMTRDGVGRRCYSWRVYRQQLDELQRRYGARTVLLSTDDHTGAVVRALMAEPRYNFLYLDYPRGQFRKRAWMEFRSDLDEHAPFSLAAELELLSEAHLFVGNMGSHTSRMFYMRMVGNTRTAVLPPFISVDGYGMCCGFTDECTKQHIKARRRPARSCIYTYGLATGGDQFFYHRG